MASKFIVDPAFKLLEDLQTRSQHSDTPAEVRQSIEKIITLIKARGKYSLDMTFPDTIYARNISEWTHRVPWEKLYTEGKVGIEYKPLWLSAAGQGQLIKFIIRMQKATRALEIGMFTGYVSMAIAEALPEDGTVVTCEYEPYLVEMTKKMYADTPFGVKIVIKDGPASETLDKLASEGQTFDFIYLDADKANYITYFKKLLDLSLLSTRGLIVVDNTLHNGSSYTEPNSVMNRFNIAVQNDDRVEQILLPIYDGVTLIRRKGE